MALTALQREVCRALAANRIASGESYVAGGAALNTLLSAGRASRDIDVFHDTEEALQATWDADRLLLQSQDYGIEIVRERPSFVEARISRGSEGVLMEWARDSAFRFFPLVAHPDFGLTLHPFDLATNKVLALVGRLEVRDWVDLIECDAGIQPFGYLVWAACGKDPGWTPTGILERAPRNHYAAAEVLALAWENEPPDTADLSRRWRAMLGAAREVVGLLPAERVGTCVLSPDACLFRGGAEQLRQALERQEVRFHEGRIRGAFPRLWSGSAP